MMKYLIFFIVLFSHSIISQTLVTSNPKKSFPLAADGKAAAIYFDNNDFTVVGIAARYLSNDIFSVSGKRPLITNSDKTFSRYMVIIGTAGKSKLIDQLIQNKKIDTAKWLNQWEAHTIQVIETPLKDVNKVLVIAGSDRRGTAYAVFELSKQIGYFYK
jgi:hypothetical protein